MLQLASHTSQSPHDLGKAPRTKQLSIEQYETRIVLLCRRTYARLDDTSHVSCPSRRKRRKLDLFGAKTTEAPKIKRQRLARNESETTLEAQRETKRTRKHVRYRAQARTVQTTSYVEETLAAQLPPPPGT